jgi:two-component system, NtrC family, response regulator AtoC
MAKILIIDDDTGFRKLLETILTGEGYDITSGGSVAEARKLGAAEQFDLVLSDLKLPDGDGLQVLAWFAENAPRTAMVMLTAFSSVETAVRAMKLGAADYLGKPLRSPDELRLLVERTLENRQTARERDALVEAAGPKFSCDQMIAEDPKMQKLLELTRKVAPTTATVLLTGESGTGKEVLARCIHGNSSRSERIFVAVNCAALTPSLIESELFGHDKGAFTGAVGQHEGRFERANGGTLFLDEIGELDANLQSKLLRVLQEKTFERVGGKRQITVDVRVIAATNRDLKASVAEGGFREDLFYRLNTFPLEIPPLRERPNDVEALAVFFLARAANEFGRSSLTLTDAAKAKLRGYGWPGNVRELENLMERVAILCDLRVDAEDLPFGETASPSADPITWDDIERKAIEDALAENGGNRTKAAKQLGISLRKLQYRLKEYGDEEEE